MYWLLTWRQKKWLATLNKFSRGRCRRGVKCGWCAQNLLEGLSASGWIQLRRPFPLAPSFGVHRHSQSRSLSLLDQSEWEDESSSAVFGSIVVEFPHAWHTVSLCVSGTGYGKPVKYGITKSATYQLLARLLQEVLRPDIFGHFVMSIVYDLKYCFTASPHTTPRL